MRPIYTGTGDKGETSLIGGERVFKDNDYIEVCGTLDELSSFVGLLIDVMALDNNALSILPDIQKKLFAIESYYASRLNEKYDLTINDLTELESEIDKLFLNTGGWTGFVELGGSVYASYANVCRTICRRAERRAVTVDDGSVCLSYLNRLSDYFFVLNRSLNENK